MGGKRIESLFKGPFVEEEPEFRPYLLGRFLSMEEALNNARENGLVRGIVAPELNGGRRAKKQTFFLLPPE